MYDLGQVAGIEPLATTSLAVPYLGEQFGLKAAMGGCCFY